VLRRVDLVEDIRAINDLAMKAPPAKTGMVILGGGVAKHHICNANLMKNGADFAVYVNTAQVGAWPGLWPALPGSGGRAGGRAVAGGLRPSPAVCRCQGAASGR
jgi:hypothetical protein